MFGVYSCLPTAHTWTKVQGRKSSLELSFPGATVPGSPRVRKRIGHEQKGQGAKVPGNELARERKGQGAKGPGYYWVLLADSLNGSELARGAKRLGTLYTVPLKIKYADVAQPKILDVTRVYLVVMLNIQLIRINFCTRPVHHGIQTREHCPQQ